MDLIDRMNDNTINQINSNGESAFFLACKHNCSVVAKKLFNRTSNETINIKTQMDEYTALHFACVHGFTITQMLIDCMTDELINCIHIHGSNAFMSAVALGNEKDALKLFNRTYHENIDYIVVLERIIKYRMITLGLKIISRLVDKQMDDVINRIDEKGITWLFRFITCNMCELAIAIIPYVSPMIINRVYSTGCTLLQYACERKEIDTANALIDRMHKYFISHVNKLNQSALTISCKNNMNETALKLIPLTAQEIIDHVDNNDCSALMYANKNDMNNVVKILAGN